MRMQAVCDYILTGKGVEWKNFRTVDVRYDTDHRLIKGRIRNRRRKIFEYKKYLQKRSSPNVDIYGEDEGVQTSIDHDMKYLNEALGRDSAREVKDRSWISEDTFKLMYQKKKALRMNRSEEVQELGRALRRSLRKDRRRRVEKVADEIQERLEGRDIIGAFDILKFWYKKFTGKAVKPAEIEI